MQCNAISLLLGWKKKSKDKWKKKFCLNAGCCGKKKLKKLLLFRKKGRIHQQNFPMLENYGGNNIYSR